MRCLTTGLRSLLTSVHQLLCHYWTSITLCTITISDYTVAYISPVTTTINISDYIDRVSVPSPIAIEKLMVRNGEGQSSHVCLFSVNFEMSEIISFILKSPSYVYIAVSGLQCTCC